MPSERGRDLDAAIAREVMGWTKVEGRDAYIGSTRKGRPRKAPMFSADRNAARLVLQEIERRGLLRRAFLNAIDDILFPPGGVFSDGDGAMGYLTATTEAICLAALTAVRGGKL